MLVCALGKNGSKRLSSLAEARELVTSTGKCRLLRDVLEDCIRTVKSVGEVGRKSIWGFVHLKRGITCILNLLRSEMTILSN